MERSRPLGVTILAVLAALGALAAIWHTLQMLGLVSVSGPYGAVRFFTFNLLGAVLFGILALIYLWLVRMLWNLDPQAWLFVTVLAVLNLVMAAVSILGNSTWQSMLPAIVVNAVILIYCLLPGTKQAFGIPTTS